MPKKEGFAGSYETRNAGKGDRPRPRQIDEERYADNYARTFGTRPPSQAADSQDTPQ